MKKKLLAIIMGTMLMMGLAACGNSQANAGEGQSAVKEDIVATEESQAAVENKEEDTKKADTENVADEKSATITIKSLNGDRQVTDLEVPYDPSRIAVIDMPSLDILNALGLGDRIVGSAKVTIEYLKSYNPDDSEGKIANLGSVKTADFEQVAACEPDVIFIGGRLAASYADLSVIAPVVYLGVDYEKGIVESTRENAKIIASMFGKEAEVDSMMTEYQVRIEALNTVLKDKNLLLAMYNNNAMSLMDTESQLNIIAKELGGKNLGEDIGEVEKAAHGEEASWETIIKLNPEYIFVLDRSTATGAADEGVLGAKEVIENDLIKQLDCYKDGKIVYFINNANVWYTATGGIQALDVMLADLEAALLK